MLRGLMAVLGLWRMDALQARVEAYFARINALPALLAQMLADFRAGTLTAEAPIAACPGATTRRNAVRPSPRAPSAPRAAMPQQDKVI